MSYDFTRFSPQSFERLVQALATATVGGQVQIFGAGKDGAREATFNGSCCVLDESWNGYVIFQAKYKTILETNSKNTDWIINQINQELVKFEDVKRGLKKPEYYVLATNVRLSAAAADATGKGSGGIDRVTKHLEAWSARLGLKGVHLWHADTISSLLDVHENVRSVFDFWVQPSEVLSKIIRHFAKPRQEEILVKYLRNSLRSARDIKTRDIGQAAGRTITLDDVFIDLPVNKHSMTSNIMDFDDTDNHHSLDKDEYDSHNIDQNPSDLDRMILKTPKILEQLIQRSADSFHPHEWAKIGDDTVVDVARRRTDPLPNRIVLLGGPGQGKSTIGQFMAQLCRARLLNILRRGQSPETNRAVDAILRAARQQSISDIGPLRYPFHVELPRYANALSIAQLTDENVSIMSFIAKDIGKSNDIVLDSNELEGWLGRIPSCIILDGLDEVPHSGNRSSVISAIENLLDGIYQVNADCIIFATSRPQGYQKELSPELWGHWQLTALEPAEALSLTNRVAPVLVSDQTRRAEILAILSEASEEEATASLMTSPLQVMLLFHLVSTHNNIPRDRWSLFHRHYEMLCEREISKAGLLGNTIRDFRSQIDRIHFDAGYLLHLRAEGRGGADAFFTDQEFAELVRRHLIQDGYDDGQDLDALTSTIANLATNRLVFLRSAVEGNVAFDVRSLQEFMAAARLTSSPEHLIRDRLIEVAGRSHWSHVFKIACAKIYASTGHESLREPVIALLDSLDAGDRTDDDRVLRTGSRIALDLLQDGTATTVPIYRKKFLIRAARLILAPHNISFWNLRHNIDFQHQNIVEPILKEALGGDATMRFTALRLLALITRDDNGRNYQWIDDLFEEFWPQNSNELFTIFDDIPFLPNREPFLSLLRSAQWLASPILVMQWVDEFTRDNSDEEPIAAGLLVCNGAPIRRKTALRGNDGNSTQFFFLYHGIADATVVDQPPSQALLEWHILYTAYEFSVTPSIQTAILFLQNIEKLDQFILTIRIGLPWVLQALVVSLSTQASFVERLQALKLGKYCDEAAWLTAERRWNEQGVYQNELIPPLDWQGVPTDIAVHGGPLTVSVRLNSSTARNAEDPLLNIIERYPNNIWALNNIIFYYSRVNLKNDKNRKEILLSKSCNQETKSVTHGVNYVRAIVNSLRYTPTEADLMQRLRETLTNYSGQDWMSLVALKTLNRLLVEDPGFRMLIQPIMINAMFYTGRSRTTISDIAVSAMITLPDDTPQIKIASAALRLLYASDTSFNKIDIKTVLEGSQEFIGQFTNALARERKHENILLTFSREAVVRYRGYVGNRASQILLNINESLPVALSEKSRSISLELPQPLFEAVRVQD